MTIMQYAIAMYEGTASNIKNADILRPLAQEIIYELINRGYNVNDIWSMGISSCNNIMIYSYPKALRLFLDKGAEPNFIFNRTSGSSNWGMWTPLNLAVEFYNLNNIQNTIEILLEYGADINKKSYINNPFAGLSLHTPKTARNGLYNPLSIAMENAATRGDHFLKIVEFLLEHGAIL
ncbi:hypothetical protein ACFLYH_02550 [Candidatus Dependentiae bacterium]